MVAKELYSDQEVGNEESNLLQDQYDSHYDNDDDDDDETLSLRDLPNSTTSPQWGDFSKEDGKNSISNNSKDHHDDDDDDNLFEFFSEEFTTSTTHDNIIFCGKLIPFKDHPNVVDQKAKLTSKSMKSSDEDDIASLKVKSFAYDYTSMGGKVSLVRSATKSRWFLFLFGMSSSSRSSSKEMKLSDIRNRLSRREPTAMFPVAPGNGKEVVKSKRIGNCKGMWKMLKSISMVLGCSSGKIANDVVKAAFV